MSYFDHLIPEKAPTYLEFQARPKFEAVAARVRNRMDLLETALMLSGMRGEDFAEAVKPIFQRVDDYGFPVMDTMDAEDLANAAIMLNGGADKVRVPDRMEWPNCQVVIDTAFVTNKEWEIIRMLGIGGSDSACIKDEGYSPAQKIYLGKIGSPVLNNEKPDSGMEFIFDFGHKIENLVIDEFCRRTGAKRVQETRMFAHKDYPFLTANIDQIVRFPDGRLFVFEAKTTTFWNRDKWEDGKVPRAYIPQCRKYPMVLNDDRICGTFIGCIFGNTPSDFYCSFIDRDKVIEEEQRDYEVAWWNDYVLAGMEPPASTTPGQNLAMAKLKAGKSDKSAPPVALDPAEHTARLVKYAELQKELTAENAKIKVIQTQMSNLSADLILDLGSAITGSCPCPSQFAPEAGKDYEFRVSYSPRAKTNCDYDKLRLVYPQAFADCVVKDPENSRTFSVKLQRVR